MESTRLTPPLAQPLFELALLATGILVALVVYRTTERPIIFSLRGQRKTTASTARPIEGTVAIETPG